MHTFKRIARHLITWPGAVDSHFSKVALQRIENAIEANEANHRGELCFCVQAALHPVQLYHKVTAKDRAIEVFSYMRVWDTEANNGILIYLLLADKTVEIVADRGIHEHVGHDGWGAICAEMEDFFKRAEFEKGVLHGIQRISDLLKKHYPKNSRHTKHNELSNKPLIL